MAKSGNVNNTKFARFDLSPATTIAYSRFNKHHTELNDLYWSFVPAYHYTRYLTKGAAPTERTQSTLVLSGDDARRPPTTMGEWRASIKEFSNWVRLGMVLSAVSYLEIYLREAVTLALRSDPFVVFGLPHQLDGVKLVKAGKKLPFDDEAKSCFTGTWHSRIANICRIFGTAPVLLQSNVAELEQIRKLRNAVGHAFGRDFGGVKNDVSGFDLQSQRLSEERLKKWLSLIQQAAAAIDTQLSSNHIGTYEYFLLYHQKKDELRKGKYGKKALPAAFSTLLAETYNRQVTRTFCEGLIAHYNAC